MCLSGHLKRTWQSKGKEWRFQSTLNKVSAKLSFVECSSSNKVSPNQVRQITQGNQSDLLMPFRETTIFRNMFCQILSVIFTENCKRKGVYFRIWLTLYNILTGMPYKLVGTLLPLLKSFNTLLFHNSEV